MRIAVVAAHTQDVVYGVGGTLLVHESARKLIIDVAPIQRTAALEVCAALGAEGVFLDGRYGYVAEIEDDVRKKLRTLLAEFKPDYLFAHPTLGEQSFDHATVGRVTLEAAQQSGIFGTQRTRFLRYPMPATTVRFEPNLWIELPYELIETKTRLAKIMTRGLKDVWTDEIVDWEIGTQQRFAQQVGWPSRHVEAFDALYAVPLDRLPPTKAAPPQQQDLHVRTIAALRDGDDRSKSG